MEDWLVRALEYGGLPGIALAVLAYVIVTLVRNSKTVPPALPTPTDAELQPHHPQCGAHHLVTDRLQALEIRLESIKTEQARTEESLHSVSSDLRETTRDLRERLDSLLERLADLRSGGRK